MHNGIKDLQLRIHASFAERSPFVAPVLGNQGFSKRSPITGSSRLAFSTSKGGSEKRSSTKAVGHGHKSVPGTANATLEEIPIPSVLQLGQIQSGATALIGERKRLAHRLRAVAQSADFSVDEENEQCVEEKLKDAQCLRRARNLGLSPLTCNLRDFQKNGGFRFCVKQLILQRCQENDDDERNTEILREFLVGEIQPFCTSLGVDFDDAVLELVGEICKRKKLSEATIRQSSFLARFCISDVAKSRSTLNVMRAALFCGIFPRWLMDLSREAASWSSSDAGLSANVQEVTRLLTIHAIIAQYCGHGARELFRVENPRHATRLLSFVTKQVHSIIKADVIVNDIFSLCQSFTHLSAASAFSALLTNSILHHRKKEGTHQENCCLSFFRTLLGSDPIVAKEALSKVLQWTMERLREDRCFSSDVIIVADNKSIPDYCRLVCDLLYAYDEFRRKEISTGLEELAHGDLIRDIVQIQHKFGLLLRPVDFLLASHLTRYAAAILEPVAQSFADQQLGVCKMAAKKAQKACSLLLMSRSKSDYQRLWAMGAAMACCARIEMEASAEFRHDEFLRFLGLIDGGETSETAAVASLTVGFSLCQAIFSDNGAGVCGHPSSNPDELTSEICRDFAIGASLLQHKSLWVVSRRSLPRIAWLNTLVDTKGLLFGRTDLGFADTVTEFLTLQLRKAWNETDEDIVQKYSGAHKGTIADLPVLNPTWYIGDGLMLPPNDTFLLASWSFRELQNHTNRGRSGTMELLELASLQGSHSMVLRILAMTLARDVSCKQRNGWHGCDDGLLQLLDETTSQLAERCLGGSVGGMTSGVIDSQLAASFLLAMPKKMAFKLYKSSIPMALETGSYDRLLALANVGRQACLQAESSDGDMYGKVGWHNQTLFFQQCQQLSDNALWWKRLVHLSVDFDPKTFTKTVAKGTSTLDAALVEKIQYDMISAVAQKAGIERAISLGQRFAAKFGQSAYMVVLLLVRFLCTPPEQKRDKQDIRGDLKYVARVVRDSIRKLRSCSKRVAILRECLINLESDPKYGIHYDRFALVLSLYHENVLSLLEHDAGDEKVDNKDKLDVELELIDRRRDALAILSAHFAVTGSRPGFDGFFVSIESFLRDGDDGIPSVANVLGQEEESNPNSCFFDPLQPLEATLSKPTLDMSAAAPLAPLCLSLGLPQGYIHARFLISRFKTRSQEGMVLPSFGNDVSPVVHKLRWPTDKMLLAEWCADRYINREGDRLSCIAVALEAATQASHDLECGRQALTVRGNSKEDLYGNIKRLSKTKTALSDRLAIKSILKSKCKRWQDGISKVVQMIVAELEETSNNGHEASPEELIEFLLSKGSLLAAKGCIDEDIALSSCHFRSIVLLIADASRFLEKEHSHIHPEASAKRLARRLLFHGNEVQANEDRDSRQLEGVHEHDDSFEICGSDDDTANFVMDLATVQNVREWSRGDGRKGRIGKPPQKTSDEELFSTKPCALREMNDVQCHVASLRSVFLLAFADQYARSGELDVELEEESHATPTKAKDGSTTTKRRGGQQSKLKREFESKRDDLMMDSARDLLRIVFSDSDGVTAIFSQNSSFAIDVKNDGVGHLRHQTVTFSMRHRALRTAAFLFPQKILQRIVSEDKHFASTMGLAGSSLKDCSFGTFVAKEIEEMGLPLPHSDLARLSSMDFSSYSRALWRNHAGRDLKGSRGRLLLLLFEMGLRSTDPDSDFLRTLIGEMERTALPRSILLSLEALVARRQQNGLDQFGPFAEIVGFGLKALLGAVVSEIQGAGWNDENEDQWLGLVQTIKRIWRVLRVMRQKDKVHNDFRSLVDKTHHSLGKLHNESLTAVIEEISGELSSLKIRSVEE